MGSRLRISSQQPQVVDEAAQHYGLPPAVIDTHLDKEDVAVAGAVVEVDAALLGQVDAVVYHPEKLHGGRVLAGVKTHGGKPITEYKKALSESDRIFFFNEKNLVRFRA